MRCGDHGTKKRPSNDVGLLQQREHLLDDEQVFRAVLFAENVWGFSSGFLPEGWITTGRMVDGGLDSSQLFALLAFTGSGWMKARAYLHYSRRCCSASIHSG